MHSVTELSSHRENCKKKYLQVNQYGNIIAQLTDNNYYDAEAVVSPDGKKILYTSMESGDLDIYIMDVDGSNKKRVSSVKNVE